MLKFEKISANTRLRGKAFNVRQDEVRAPDGQIIRLDIVEHCSAVTILPIDQQKRVWFVRQYRHAAGELLLELPAGMVEEGEEPLACAEREIREEIGMAARRLEEMGGFYLAPGYSTEYMHIFLATDLYPAPLPGDSDEFLHIEQIPLDQIAGMAARGDIKDAKTLAVFYLLQGKLV